RSGYVFTIDWQIRYKDLVPWYSYVEKFVGISGEYDGLDTLPDGVFLKSMGLNGTEKYFRDVVAQKYNNQHHVIYGRGAHITKNNDIVIKKGQHSRQRRALS